MAKEISLKELLTVIKKRLWLIILAAVLAATAGYFYGTFFKSTPLYQSSTRILIKADSGQMSTLVVMIKDPSVLNQVSQTLNLQKSANALANEITAESINDSQVVSISVIDSNPKVAAAIANKTASVFKREAASILDFTKIRQLTKAKENSFPINPEDPHKTVLGFVAGLVIGVGLAFLLNAMDDTIQSEKELEILLGSPVLGSISRMKRKNMYKRSSRGRLRKGVIEFPNVWKRGAQSRKSENEKSESPHQNQDMEQKEMEPIKKANNDG